MLKWAICFTQSNNLNVHLMKKPNIMSNQISVDPVKLMHKSYVHMWTHTHTTH